MDGQIQLWLGIAASKLGLLILWVPKDATGLISRCSGCWGRLKNFAGDPKPIWWDAVYIDFKNLLSFDEIGTLPELTRPFQMRWSPPKGYPNHLFLKFPPTFGQFWPSFNVGPYEVQPWCQWGEKPSGSPTGGPVNEEGAISGWYGAMLQMESFNRSKILWMRIYPTSMNIVWMWSVEIGKHRVLGWFGV